MDRLRFALVSTVTKLTANLIGVSGRGKGQAAPGLVALKLDPELIKRAHKYFSKSTFITGTNGKTTTTKLLTLALRKSGQKVISNETGSNLERGLAASIASYLSGFGKIGSTMAVWEADESAFAKMMPELNADVVVLLNLFRDQLDRYGEIDSTAKKIHQAIKSKKHLRLVVNADDPYMVAIAREFENVTYVSVKTRLPKTTQKLMRDAISCPYCFGELIFRSPLYSHLGEFSCQTCSFASPKSDYEVIDFDSRFLQVKRGKNIIKLPRIPGGFYNIYNELSAFAAAELLGVKVNDFTLAAKEFRVPFGRYEKLDYKNKEVTTILVKNPTGMSQALQSVVEEDKHNTLVLGLNSKIADGRDTSWIWDVDFEDFVVRSKTFTFVVTGERRWDMALRIKTAGVLPDRIIVEGGYRSALDRAIKTNIDAIYYLPTYTALMESLDIFKSKPTK